MNHTFTFGEGAESVHWDNREKNFTSAHIVLDFNKTGFNDEDHLTSLHPQRVGIMSDDLKVSNLLEKENN